MRSNYSLKALWISVLVIGLVQFVYYPKWEKTGTESAISWDVSGYYWYLPAFLIYQDPLQQTFRDSILQQYGPTPDFQQAYQHANGNFIMKYSAGMSILYLPGFLAAHILAKPLGFPADGFSAPYQLAISIWSFLVVFIGLYALRKVLQQYFKDTHVAASLLLIVLGSNYLNYAAIDGMQTHSYLFTLYSLLLLATMRFYKRPNAWTAVAIGACVGMAALVRPTELLTALIPLIWGIGNPLKETALARVAWLRTHAGLIAAAALTAAVIGSIQAIYWKYSAGTWIEYSYQDQGFSWLSPYIYKCLFSTRAGWLTYSPAMFFSLWGFYYLYKNKPGIFAPVFFYALLFMYIAFSWDIWWYGGSLGQRTMVQLYPVLAFPMTAFIQAAAGWNRYYRWILIIVITACIYHNLWVTHASHRGGILFPGSMTDAYMAHILWRYEVQKESLFLLDTDELYMGDRSMIHRLKTEGFEQDTVRGACNEPVISGAGSFCLSGEAAPAIIQVEISPENSGSWLRGGATFRAGAKEWDIWKSPYLMFRLYLGDKVIKEKHIRLFRVLEHGETKELWADLKIKGLSFDRAELGVFNPGTQLPLLIDDMYIEGFSPGR